MDCFLFLKENVGCSSRKHVLKKWSLAFKGLDFIMTDLFSDSFKIILVLNRPECKSKEEEGQESI